MLHLLYTRHVTHVCQLVDIVEGRVPLATCNALQVAGSLGYSVVLTHNTLRVAKGTRDVDTQRVASSGFPWLLRLVDTHVCQLEGRGAATHMGDMSHTHTYTHICPTYTPPRGRPMALCIMTDAHTHNTHTQHTHTTHTDARTHNTRRHTHTTHKDTHTHTHIRVHTRTHAHTPSLTSPCFSLEFRSLSRNIAFRVS